MAADILLYKSTHNQLDRPKTTFRTLKGYCSKFNNDFN